MDTMKIFLPTVLATSLVIAGCGGGGGGSSPTPSTAKLAFALVSTAQPRVESFELTISLPQGVAVKTVTGSTELDSTAVQGINNFFVMGTYSAAVQRVHIVGVKPDGLFGAPNNFSYQSTGRTLAEAVALNCTLSGVSSGFDYALLGGSLSGGSTSLTNQKANSSLTITLGY